jgi:ubiquinone/menaquinone biosynthesis C-methylase UbiE
MTAFLERFQFQDEYLASRAQKAEKIVAVLRAHGLEVSKSRLLDVGCSCGIITSLLAKEFKWLVGVDLERSITQTGHGEFDFIQADACYLPLDSGSFDAVILNHVLEHVIDSPRLLGEIWRILVPGGRCYLACPNRFSLIEPHYRLPFLSWLPRSWADAYVRLFKRGECYLDYPPGYFRLLKMVHRFEICDLSIEMIKNSRMYFPDDKKLMRQTAWVRWLPTSLLKGLRPIFPVFILLLFKPIEVEHPSTSS